MPNFKTFLRPVIPVPVAIPPPPESHVQVAFVIGGNPVANTAQATSLFLGATGVEDLVIPADLIPWGASLRFSLLGDATMAASGTPTLTIEVTVNDLVVARVQYTTASAMNNRSGRFSLEGAISRKSETETQAAGVMRIGADDENQSSTQASMVKVADADFSGPITLDITAKWGAAHPATSIRNGYCDISLRIPRSVQARLAREKGGGRKQIEGARDSGNKTLRI